MFDIQRVGLSLAIVIGFIFAARFAMRKMFPAAVVGRSSQAIRVVSRSVLAPKQQFLLLQVGKRLIVVGDTGSSMNALAEITEPGEVASIIGQLGAESSHSSVSSFASLFRKTGTEFHREHENALRTAEQNQSDSEIESETDEADQPDEETEQTGTIITSASASDPVQAVSGEISGLMERVRLLSQQVRRS